MFDDLLKIATGGTDKIFDDLYKSAKGALQKKVNEKLAVHKIRALLEKISQIGKVKTILDPDNIVEINSIYCEGVITFENIDKIRGVKEFNAEKILIEGGPGQGKSIYLKYLCLEEAKNGWFIPIFIEFRNLKFKCPLKEELMVAIQEYGINIDTELFDYLAKSDKLLFILDGFDEIPFNSKLQTAKDLEQIARTYKNLRIIISSRPDAGMGGSVYFQTFKIQPLTLAIQRKFLNHIFNNEDESKPIQRVIEENEFLAKVTKTPLLLTLFAITYKAEHFKPDSIAEFYRIIFPTMLYRHDRMKIGFERERKSKLSDFLMERIFETLSFLSLKEGEIRFSSSDFKNYLHQAMEHQCIGQNLEDELIEDITNITALIVKDGYENYSYVHRSIQEYFSAKFISRLTDTLKMNFYNGLTNDYYRFTQWQNVLNFLSTIDAYNYSKYFLLPVRKQTIGQNDSGKIKFKVDDLENLIGLGTKIKIDENGELIEVFWGDIFSTSTYPQFFEFLREEIQSYLREERVSLAKYLSFCELDEYENYIYTDKIFVLQLLDYLKNTKKRPQLIRYISKKIKNSKIMKDMQNLENEIAKTERMNQKFISFKI